MSVARLQLIARNNYGIELTLEEVRGRIEAYHQLCQSWTATWRTSSTPGSPSPGRSA